MTANPLRLAFVSPRYPLTATVGGAETLLAALAQRAARLGHRVEFLTTCARDHFSWRNEHEPGAKTIDGITVRFFPVNAHRDLEAFSKAQSAISRGGETDAETQETWLRNGVNSDELLAHLRQASGSLDRIVAGPYLYGLIRAAAAVAPDRTFLVPCLHDEAFAYLACFRDMFRSVRGFIFNSEPERDLAVRLYGLSARVQDVVGIGLDPFTADAAAFPSSRNIKAPYIIYSGRREPMKGTPLLLDYFSCYLERTRRPLKLVLTGSGAFEIPAGAGDTVIDAGFLPEREKREAMAGALAFVHPSVNESLSIVLLESWMAGTPALVHAMGRVLVHQCRSSGGGLWFGSYPEFEECVSLLLDRPDLRASLGRLGREYVLNRYGWDAVERRLDSALRK